MKWIIMGLGNPGGEYDNTRHNVGFAVADALAEDAGFPPFKFSRAYRSLASRGAVLGIDVLLLKPETYMNDSGKALVTLVKSPEQSEQLIVIHDDIDLPIGTWKIAFDRGDGGHNGLKSIIATLKTKAFIRIRVGVARVDEDGKVLKPKGEDAVVKFVLGKFIESERTKVKQVTKNILKAIPEIMTLDLERAMNEWNQKKG